MSIVFQQIYRFEPHVGILCKIPHNAIYRGNGFYLQVYHPEPLIDVKCNLCPEGTTWDEECQDCIPVCFPNMLSILQIINANLPAKIITET